MPEDFNAYPITKFCQEHELDRDSELKAAADLSNTLTEEQQRQVVLLMEAAYWAGDDARAEAERCEGGAY